VRDDAQPPFPLAQPRHTVCFRLLLAFRAERRGCRCGQVMSRGGLYEAGVLHMLDMTERKEKKLVADVLRLLLL